MRHLTEEELLQQYYKESPQQEEQQIHLDLCKVCGKAYVSLKDELDAIPVQEAPFRGEAYGEEVWLKLQSRLPIYEKKASFWNQLWHWKPLIYAISCLLLVTTAFFFGRQWERRNTNQQQPMAQNNEAGKERVVLMVVGDHLDRSERLLVALNHADTADGSTAAPLKKEAKELLVENRLYRENAQIAADPLMTGALDHLERVLVELSHQPEGITPKAIAQLQKEMNTKDLLFEIRVLRTKTKSAAQGTRHSGDREI